MSNKRLIHQLVQDVGDIKSDVAVIKRDVQDMQPRVEMLNHWHTEVDHWRKSIDSRLKIAAVLGTIGSFAYAINAAINLWGNVSHWLH